MLTALELKALFVETLLLDRSVEYIEPYMIRFVFGLDPFTPFRVRLDIEPLALSPLCTSDRLDSSPGLTIHVLTYETLEARLVQARRGFRTRLRTA